MGEFSTVMQTLPTPTENVFYRLNNNLTFLVRKNFDFPRLGYGSLFLLLSLWLFVFVICFVRLDGPVNLHVETI